MVDAVQLSQQKVGFQVIGLEPGDGFELVNGRLEGVLGLRAAPGLAGTIIPHAYLTYHDHSRA